MLVLEIEFLTGLCRAARVPAEGAPDWPPQPDRVFSALVAAWGARGEDAGERRALEWLEAQDTPRLLHGEATGRTAPAVFVPPNDAAASATEKRYLQVLPERRSRQPRRFPAARPELVSDSLGAVVTASPTADRPRVHLALLWRAEPEPAAFASLDALARDVPYLGHSASLVRCRFRRGAAEPDGVPAGRRIYRGRLAELERAFYAEPKRRRPSPGEPTRTFVPASGTLPHVSCFSPDWLVLEIVEGAAPDLRAATLVTRRLRDALMSGYGRIGEAPPGALSGHAPDGSPSSAPHLAFAPLAFAGWPHADGRLLGFALIPPMGAEGATLLDDPVFACALHAVSHLDQELERRVLTICGEPLRGPLRLAPAGAATRKSLRPEPYIEAARVWASVTPIALDRHLKESGAGRDREMREVIAKACMRIGLPQPDPDRIRVDKHSAIEGVPSVRVRGGPSWTSWRKPDFLKTRTLVHAVIDFGQSVRGPLLLGAGRFAGLGLCRGLR